MEVSQYTSVLTTFVCLALIVGMMVSFSLGHRGGLRHRRIDPEGARSVSGPVEAAIYALFGLLVAFTFSGAADRFDSRRALITDEVNALSVAWLRLDLLADADRATLRSELRDYVDARLAFYAKLPDASAAQGDLTRAEALETRIWAHTVAAVRGGQVVSPQLVLPSINRVFDVAEARRMALLTHPPLPIYGLLIVLALVCAGLAGHHASSSERHPWLVALLFSGVSALAIYVILDLEYPRAGFIRLDAADALLRELRMNMS